jgi:CheY-like chemotaxis protein
MGSPLRRILLVEDDEGVREALAELLSAEGYRVDCARDGREALGFAAVVRPALIVLDLSMPVMDGWAFRAAQLADPRLASVPVIVLSAAHGGEAASARLAPAAYLTKPVEFERLLTLVHRYVGAPRARPAEPAAVASAAR